jgi:CRP-like cAMP-binding protein
MDGSVRTADATAGLVRLLRVGAPVFLEALATEPALGRNLCRLLAARLRHTFALLQDATFGSLEVRLARQILYLARRGGRCTEQGLRLAGRCRQGDLADMRGTTTRSIIPILNVWRQSGVVAYELARAQLTLTGEAALQALVEKGATG